jgi:hypothetical protein
VILISSMSLSRRPCDDVASWHRVHVREQAFWIPISARSDPASSAFWHCDGSFDTEQVAQRALQLRIGRGGRALSEAGPKHTLLMLFPLRATLAAFEGSDMIALLMLATATSPTTGFVFGRELYEWCKESSRPTCITYVMGISDELVSLQATGKLKKRYCSPAQVTGGQLADVVLRSLHDHPERQHLPAASVVSYALIDAFPCPKRAHAR